MEGPKATREKLVPIADRAESVAYLGVELPKARNSENAPKQEQYKDYINDAFSLALQQKIAISIKQGDPVLIEAGTSIGKTTTIKKMCADLGYEVHYVNLNGATDVEDLMGRYVPNRERKSTSDPEYVFADGRVTSGLRQEEGKIKVIILDEYNSTPPNILIRLHEVLDALERDGEIVLSEDASEKIQVNKNVTKIVGLMNPPGRGYLQREPLDPAQIRRWVYHKEVSGLPKETLEHATRALFSLEGQGGTVPESAYLFANEKTLTPQQMGDIPGIKSILPKYLEFHEAAKKLVENRIVAADQPQKFFYDDREEPKHVRDFIAMFYRGDLTATMQDALRYYYTGKVLDPQDKQKLEELIRTVEYVAPVDSRRKSFDSEMDSREFGRGLDSGTSFISVTGNRIEATDLYATGDYSIGDLLKVREGVKVADDVAQSEKLQIVGFTDDGSVIIRIDDGRVVVVKHRSIESMYESIGARSEKTPFTEAERIMGTENFLGPADVEKVFGFKLEKVPDVPFTNKELEQAKKLGQQLILQINSMNVSQELVSGGYEEVPVPITLENLKRNFEGSYHGSTPSYEKEDFFKSELPRTGWKLVSKKVIPGSLSKNYLEQTDALRWHLDEIFEERTMPVKYVEAIAEFHSKRSEIESLMKSDWRKASELLANLEITKLTRESPVEVMYRLILQDETRSEKLLESIYTSTSARASDGMLVGIGYFDTSTRVGVGVGGYTPDSRFGHQGVCFSRMN